MKRILLFIAAAVFLLAPLAAASVKVVSPNGGETWVLGSPQNITWMPTNPGNVKVDIILRRGNTKVGVIKSQVLLSDGSWQWPYVGILENGTKVPDGTDYIVRIRDAGDTFRDDSYRPFAISTGGQPPPPPPPPPGGPPSNVLRKTYTIDMDSLSQPLVQLKPELIVCKILPQILDKSLYRQKMQFRVHNIGQGSAPPCKVRIDLGGVHGPQPIKALNPGEYEEITYENAAIHWEGVDILYRFYVDEEGLVAESNENNNKLTGVLSAIASESEKCSDGRSHQVF